MFTLYDGCLVKFVYKIKHYLLLKSSTNLSKNVQCYLIDVEMCKQDSNWEIT